MQLKAADTWNRSCGGANFRRIVRKSRNVITVKRGGIRELAAGDLHAVTGVACEADHRLIEHFALAFYRWNFCKCRHSSPEPPLLNQLPLSHWGIRLHRCGSILKGSAVRRYGWLLTQPPATRLPLAT